MNRTRRLFLTAPVAALVLGACGNGSQASNTEGGLPMNISVKDLATRLESDKTLLVLDVRSPEEYTQDGHVPGSVLIPLPELAMRLNEVPKDRPVACFCRSGNRSQVACDMLRQQGYTNVTNVLGGIGAWRGANLPTEF
ncbi:MAG: rhodanese-like domain-containing protein [Roseiflexaceae bacterium]